MSYVSFSYYSNTYKGTLILEENFPKISDEASMLVDLYTTRKLTYAFPRCKKDSDAVKMCICSISDWIYKIEQEGLRVDANIGYTTDENGIVHGKVATSISSGDETRSYSSGSNVKRELSELATDSEKRKKFLYDIVVQYLTGVPDARGVLLLYRGL